MVTLRAQAGDIARFPADAVIVNLFDGVTRPAGATGAVDNALNGAISQLIADNEITGKQGEIAHIHTLGKIPPKRVVIVGLGNREKLNPHAIRDLAAEAARYAQRIGARSAASIAHGAGIGAINPAHSAQAIAEGSILGLYRFNRHQASNNDNKLLNEITLVDHDPSRIPALADSLRKGAVLAECAALARDLVNEPANVINPARLAEIATDIARDANLHISALNRDDIAQHGMNAILAVSSGSASEPRLISMEYLGDPNQPENNIALIGKGVTFDSGGISIKGANRMWEMKGDMSGAAAVIAAMKAIANLQPRINVFGVVPAVENMPSGTALRPGDIIRAMNGKTIEVDNTDAEGRLILADAISYIRQTKNPQRIVDIATLTSAAIVALGHVSSALMGTSQTLVDSILAASRSTGEKLWQLPLFDEYKRQIRSDYADIKNTGGRPAGAITAALFIAEFTENAQWAHLDIAGTFLSDRLDGHLVKGATGVPARTLVQLVENLAAANN